MRQAKINLWRADCAERCMKHEHEVYETGPGIDAGITDLICHLRHLCDKHKLDFDELNDRAAWHYDCEVNPDDIERGLRQHLRASQSKVSARGTRNSTSR